MSNVEYTTENRIHFIKIKGKARLIPIVRETTELFSQTVIRAQSKANLTVCINASWFEITSYRAVAAVLSSDKPLPVTDIINQGQALLGTGKRYGRTSPLSFYIAQKQDYSWAIGQGDVPSKGFYTGVGGLCPLIIDGLKYGVNNEYKKPFKDAILNGEPHPQHKPYLIQRSNATYKDLYAADKRAGRAGLGIDKNGDLLIVVQEHGGGTRESYDSFRDIFIDKGCKNALSVDGSDSVFLWYNQKFQIKAAADKDESQLVGIGIRAE